MNHGPAHLRDSNGPRPTSVDASVDLTTEDWMVLDALCDPTVQGVIALSADLSRGDVRYAVRMIRQTLGAKA